MPCQVELLQVLVSYTPRRSFDQYYFIGILGLCNLQSPFPLRSDCTMLHSTDYQNPALAIFLKLYFIERDALEDYYSYDL
jgi:hypothetical protein